MTSGTEYQTADLDGRTVYDRDDQKIGTIGQIWLDDQSGQPDWVTVQTGMFGMNESFLPVDGLYDGPDGDLRTPFSKDQVKDAPNLDPSSGHLDPDQERRLFEHYGLTGGQERYASDAGAGDTGWADSGTEGYDTSGPTTDDAMTRSEERLQVGTEQVEAGRARLRKYVVTEQEQVQVPVTRERVRLETEPITEANRDEATTGPDISEEEHEVVLHEERPTIDKETVPVERVRMTTEAETQQRTVSGEVRKERIETEGDVDGR